MLTGTGRTEKTAFDIPIGPNCPPCEVGTNGNVELGCLTQFGQSLTNYRLGLSSEKR